MYVCAPALSASSRPGRMSMVPRPRRWYVGCTARMWRTGWGVSRVGIWRMDRGREFYEMLLRTSL